MNIQMLQLRYRAYIQTPYVIPLISTSSLLDNLKAQVGRITRVKLPRSRERAQGYKLDAAQPWAGTGPDAGIAISVRAQLSS